MSKIYAMYTPYIGITDFTHSKQVEQMLSVFDTHHDANQNRRLHIGVMMSYKTLHGLESKWTKIFPHRDVIADIFVSPKTMNCLHYADYEGVDVAESVARAIVCGGEGMNALQLDMVWPDPRQIARAFTISKRPREVILQVSSTAMELAHNDAQEIVARIGAYGDDITHVLLDRSMGRGIGMDAESLIPLLRVIQGAFPHIGIVVAGGLGPETTQLIAPIIEEFPNISIDAQGKLRPSGSALDPVDWGMAELYLMRALQILDNSGNGGP